MVTTVGRCARPAAGAWAAEAGTGAGNQASTVISSAVRAPRAAQAGGGAMRRQRPVRSSPRMIFTPSLGGQHVALGTTVGGRPGRGLRQPGERRYAVRTTLPGEAGRGRLWSDVAMAEPAGQAATL